MNVEQIKILMEENGIEEEKINEFFSAIEKNYKEKEKENVIGKISQEWELKMLMDKEKDWRKKTAIAAKIISLNLEIT